MFFYQANGILLRKNNFNDRIIEPWNLGKSIKVEKPITGVKIEAYSPAPASITSDTEALAYIASYDDLISSLGTDTAGAIKHYDEFGKAEGRTITFDVSQYLANYTDLSDFFSAKNGYTKEAIIIGALRHFIETGHGEGRTDSDLTTDSTTSLTTYSTTPASITSDTEALAYIASYDDLISSLGTDTAGAIKHYDEFGKAEGRTITFDVSQYLANYTDLSDFFSAKNGYTKEAIIIGALRHFIETGHGEGRTDSDLTTAPPPAPAPAPATQPNNSGGGISISLVLVIILVVILCMLYKKN